MTDSLDPAARLHGLLDHCRQHSGVQSLSSTWGTYLEVAPNTVDYVQAVAQLVLLPGEVRTAFANLKNQGVSIPYDFFLEPLPSIEGALAFGVQGQSGQTVDFVLRYSEAQTDRILGASALLKGHAASPVDASSLLETVASTADDLSALLADDDTLEPEVRELLYSLADGLRRTAQTFKISGAEGVARERDLLVGRLAMNNGLQQEVGRHTKVMDVIARFLRSTAFVASFFTTAVTADEDVEKIIRAITAG
ncbi:hypothetical protein [Curtobacterium sp. MCBD17_040]|uniref:hypothetical protein n=1 Tax=Curtobacterium sp. MCBD17_040 TaxID=2175674 RepID=UPI0011B6DF17|nr:hypothetical protein [Curtobacterium sp. MCBD17_040]WIB65361.1 hypothetical protein DEI94_18310 [Curtobacterium sp. MCBD17_040]